MSYPTIRLRDVAPQSRCMVSWERVKRGKIHFFAQMVAEMLGVFLYVYGGVGATAGFVVGNLTSQPIGSLLTIGFGYAVGIMLAITICGSTSGGHFNPGVTISFVVFRGFPIRKAVGYILAQIFGAFVAALLVYVQWKDFLVTVEGVLVKKHLYNAMMFTPEGPAGIFAVYVSPGTNLHRVLLNEFVTDLVLGLAISASLDPTNHFVPPAAAPWVVGIAYGMAIWGFSTTSLSTNTARDLGARLMAMAIWGRPAAGGPYAAIAALTNIPATVLAFFLYDTILCSSARTLTPQHASLLRAHELSHEDNALVPAALESSPHNDVASERSSGEKPTVNTVEFAARNV